VPVQDRQRQFLGIPSATGSTVQRLGPPNIQKISPKFRGGEVQQTSSLVFSLDNKLSGCKMDNNDGISVLTFPEGEQQAVFCVNGPRRYFCKYESCAKSFVHTSSLYRHHRMRHVGGLVVKREDLNTNSSTDSSDANLYMDKR